MKFNTLFLVLVLLFPFKQNCFSQDGDFSKKEILEDLDSLKNILEKSHFNLYAYTSKQEFDSNFNEVRASVAGDSISLKQATDLFQKVISKANVGHAEIDFPAQSYISFAQRQGRIFPLEIALENEKAFVRRNYSGNSEIKSGIEILAINGESIDNILTHFKPHISAEREYLKNAKIEFWSFPRLYWQVYGEKSDFRIRVRETGEIKQYEIQAIPAMEAYEYKRKDILSSNPRLEFYGLSAYLNPGNFSGDEDAFRNFIDSAFAEINKTGSKYLVLDLRNNGGGNNSFSDYLVSYFADEKFTWNSKFSLKTSKYLKQHTRRNNDTTDQYFQEILKRKNGEIFDYHIAEAEPQPESKRFEGEVFALVNRQTYSQAAVTAALLQDYDFATIVGEETGDYPSLYASIFPVELPNTKILVKIPKGRILRVNQSEKAEGVIPEIQIKDHLLDEDDEILNALLKRLNKK